MAFLTLAQLRARLNQDLACADGSEQPWGDRATRNGAIRSGFERLEPGVMRLIQEDVPTTDSLEYDLTSGIRDVELIEQVHSNGQTRDIKNYRAWLVQDDPPVCRIRLASPLSTDSGLVVTGHAPYISELSAEADACDMEARYVWIPLMWARAELYRRRFHLFLDYEQYNAENPTTTIEPGTLYQAYQDAARLFEQAKSEHSKAVSIPRRARLGR